MWPFCDILKCDIQGSDAFTMPYFKIVGDKIAISSTSREGENITSLAASLANLQTEVDKFIRSFKDNQKPSKNLKHDSSFLHRRLDLTTFSFLCFMAISPFLISCSPFICSRPFTKVFHLIKNTSCYSIVITIQCYNNLVL